MHIINAYAIDLLLKYFIWLFTFSHCIDVVVITLNLFLYRQLFIINNKDVHALE